MMFRVLTALALMSCAAEREPGPHASEEGLVTYWEVVVSEGRTDQCTDSADWSEVVLGPVLSEGSFLMYRVENGGQTATGQSCDTLSSSSCSDSALLWQIDGHTFVYQAEPQALESTGDCEIRLLATWTVIDEGETAFFSVSIQFEYEADEPACENIEDSLRSESPNGFGLTDCLVSLDADLSFATVN